MSNTDFEIKFKKGTRIEQIERACLILFTIFDVLHINSGEAVEDTDTLPLSQIANLCQIGTAFVDSVWENISDFIEPEEDKEFSTNNES